MTEHADTTHGKVIPAPPEVERSLFPKDRRLRLVRIDEDSYHGWYLREVPDEAPLLFVDDGNGPLIYDMLERALSRLRQHNLGINIDGHE